MRLLPRHLLLQLCPTCNPTPPTAEAQGNYDDSGGHLTHDDDGSDDNDVRMTATRSTKRTAMMTSGRNTTRLATKTHTPSHLSTHPASTIDPEETSNYATLRNLRYSRLRPLRVRSCLCGC